MLATIPATNGLWRLQIGIPLACLLAACCVGTGGLRLGIISGAIALVVAVQPMLPLRPTANGDIDLPSILFANPRETQPRALFNVWKDRPFFVALEPGASFTRRLWLAPGRYRLEIQAEGQPVVMIDGVNVESTAGGEPTVEIAGHLHTLELGSTAPARLYRLALQPS
jgi:hypothetical protein